MSAKRRNQTAALIVPYTSETATDLPLRVVPEATAINVESSGTAQSSKKSKQAKTLKKKRSTVKNRIVQQKTAKKQSSKVKLAARRLTKKTVPSLTGNARPQLVPAEQTSALEFHTEMTPDPNADLTRPASPVLVMPEDKAVEPETMAHAEMSLDRNAEELCISGENDAITLSETHDPIAGPLPVSAEEQEKLGFLQALALQWTRLLHALTQTWNWTQQKLKSNQLKKRLRICESVSLGDKRFIAVIQVDGEQFLVGGSSSSVATLAHLEPRREFSDVFRSRCEQDLSRA
jgi:hypothetical protein